MHLAHLQLAEPVVDDLRLRVDLGTQNVELRVCRRLQRVGLVDRCELALVSHLGDGFPEIAAARGDLVADLASHRLYSVDDLLA